VRAGWAAAAAAVSAKGEDALLMGEFGNLDDEELGW
jgi:antitoxin MazE